MLILNPLDSFYGGKGAIFITQKHSFMLNKHKAMKTELRFKEWLDENKIYYKFQKGFLIPFHRIVDFYIPNHGLIIEIDGGYHNDIKEKDSYKDDTWAEERGMRTIRILNKDVWNGDFIPRLSFLLDK